MAKLDGKVAVITAATSGMALATAKLFVQEGAYVFITGRRQQQLDDAAAAIGRNVTPVQGDAGNLADLDRLYDVVKREKGHIDILRQRRRRRVRADRRGHRGALRQDLRPERARHALHRPEGAAPDRRRWLDHHERLGREREGLPRLRRLQRQQGRRPVVRAHLDRRSEGAQDPRERAQPGHHRHGSRRPSQGGEERLRRADPAAPSAVRRRSRPPPFLASSDSSSSPVSSCSWTAASARSDGFP